MAAREPTHLTRLNTIFLEKKITLDVIYYSAKPVKEVISEIGHFLQSPTELINKGEYFMAYLRHSDYVDLTVTLTREKESWTLATFAGLLKKEEEKQRVTLQRLVRKKLEKIEECSKNATLLELKAMLSKLEMM